MLHQKLQAVHGADAEAVADLSAALAAGTWLFISGGAQSDKKAAHPIAITPSGLTGVF